MTDYEERVIGKLLSYSKNPDYNTAKREWTYKGEVFDCGAPIEKCQLCGHQIQYQYRIHNRENGRHLDVGSECVGNYTNISPDTLIKSRKKMELERRIVAGNRMSQVVSKAHRDIEAGLQKKHGLVSTKGFVYNYETGKFFEQSPGFPQVTKKYREIKRSEGYMRNVPYQSLSNWNISNLILGTRNTGARLDAKVLRDYSEIILGGNKKKKKK